MDARKLFFTLCAGIILTIGSVGYGLFWANGQLQNRAAGIRQLNNENAALEAKIQNAHKLEAELEDHQDLIRTAQEVLPATKNQENIVAELVTIADSADIVLDSISFASGAVNDPSKPELSQANRVEGLAGVYSYVITTSFVSSYPNTLTLLQKLEENKRRLEVTDIDISPRELTDGQPTTDYDTSLTIITYTKP